jgi:hypothetical protein
MQIYWVQDSGLVDHEGLKLYYVGDNIRHLSQAKVDNVHLAADGETILSLGQSAIDVR